LLYVLGELVTLDRVRGGAAEPGRFLELAIGAAAALGEAHAAGLIHRDVKPHAFLVDDATGRVHLGALGRATRVPRREQAAARPELIEGTLAYMSPEQTGRMNRAVDQRSDLYSLGVTFYQLLTGTLPFAPADPLEWLHCHLARTPAAPADVDPAVPEALSRLVMKLLAKDPEDRYQSAAGVLADLARCRAQWDAEHRIEPFPLGAHDVSDRWLLPQRLSGREADGARLLAAFDRVAAGQGPVLVVLSGPAGVGKSALVNDLLAPIARAGGVFLSGKSDEYDQRIPYATFVQALRGRIQDLLTGSDVELGRWRERLREALGTEGQVMVDLIPALELVMGPQPPVPELGPAEAQARVARLFRALLSAVAEPGRPLAVFLDDLQWADPASLRLLEPIADRDRNLLLIGAYRDGEVAAEHPLRAALRAIRKAGRLVDELPVDALPPAAIEDLVAATVHRPRLEVAPLAALVHGKTGGNPFFARQFLTGLYGDGLISFDRGGAQWTWDDARIATCALTSNVAELIVARMSRLPPGTLRALQVAAAVGPTCELGLLAALLELGEPAVDDLMVEAVTAGLLVRREHAYQFAHDRVRQAAYWTIPEGDRPALHLRVGRTWLQRTPEAGIDDVVFDLARQFNLGAAEVADASLSLRAADLNLRAGLRAKRAAAHGAAVAYLTDGIAHVRASGEVHGVLAFTLEVERATCELLDGHLERARDLLADLLARASTPAQKATVYRLRQGVFQLTGEIALAVEDELAGLRACGIELPARPTDEDVARELARVQQLLAAHPPAALLALPPMADPTASAAMLLVTPSFFTDPRLFFVHVARMVALTIERGLSDATSYFFSNYALALVAFGEHRQARALADVGRQLAARQPLSPRLPEATFALSGISFWTDPYDEVIARYREAQEQAVKNGAIETPAMCATSVLMVRLARGDGLPAVEEEVDAELATLVRLGRDMGDVLVAGRQLVRRLRGRTRGLDTFDEEGFDGRAFTAALTSDRMSTAMCWCHVIAQRAAYLAGDLAEARAAGERAGALLFSTLATPGLHDYVIYRALTLAASLDGERREEWTAELRAHEQRARGWADLNPVSFRHNHLLVAAELARVEGRAAEAAALYDRSAAGAAAGGFGLDEALAWELAARHHRAQGAERLWELCLREARAAYARVDAAAKVRQIDDRLAEGGVRPVAAATTLAPDQIDLLSVVRASLAISGETTVEQVTFRLMELVLAEGGAERGLLVVPRREGLAIAARAAVTGPGIDVQMAEAPADGQSLPLSLVSYVWRTGESLVLDDAGNEPRFAADPYVVEQRPRAVLAMPIRRQGRAVGLLYLENRALAGVFRPRLQVLELLAAQAAISLENAALLGQERVARAQALEAVRLRDEFLSVASHELNTPLSTLVLSVQTLREGGRSEAESARLTDLIDRQAGRLARLVNDLLDATRLQQKLLVLEREITDLSALVRDVVTRLGPQLQQARCPTELVLAPARVNVDRGRIEQVLSNLLSNAMKFGPGKPITVTTGTRQGRAVLSVSDHGIGIDPARQPRIFERFERGVSPRHYGGLGLGLYISRQIVDAHGGTIEVRSAPGEGATFTVELPV
jgi:predicted ATPase/signal transduction histidine kinase